MNGAEIKKLVKRLNIKQKELARNIGVSEQALTSYFRTTDLRQETIDKIEVGIRQMTNGQYSVYFVPNENAEPASTTVPEPTQQKNIIDTLSGVVKDLERELADVRIIRAELIQARNDFRAATADLRTLITQLNNPSLPMAADENPRPK